MSIKKVYLIAVEPSRSTQALGTFLDEDKVEVLPSVWLVRSGLTSAAEVAASLGITAKPPTGLGIVVSAEFYSGRADGSVLEKLRIWGSADAGLGLRFALAEVRE